jgi:hypothetical protein
MLPWQAQIRRTRSTPQGCGAWSECLCGQRSDHRKRVRIRYGASEELRAGAQDGRPDGATVARPEGGYQQARAPFGLKTVRSYFFTGQFVQGYNQ